MDNPVTIFHNTRPIHAVTHHLNRNVEAVLMRGHNVKKLYGKQETYIKVSSNLYPDPLLRAGPRTLECGGASGPCPEQSNTGYDVSGVSRMGGEYERGSPPLI